MPLIYRSSTEVIFTDSEIETLISEPKIATVDIIKSADFERSGRTRCAQVKLKGETTGHSYEVILRENLMTGGSFSAILGVYPPEYSKLFLLRRYNFHSSEHTNVIEKERFFGYHIHTATERYQRLKGRSPESYAELTDRFKDFHEAIKCLINDCGIVLEDKGQSDLLRWLEKRDSGHD